MIDMLAGLAIGSRGRQPLTEYPRRFATIHSEGLFTRSRRRGADTAGDSGAALTILETGSVRIIYGRPILAISIIRHAQSIKK